MEVLKEDTDNMTQVDNFGNNLYFCMWEMVVIISDVNTEYGLEVDNYSRTSYCFYGRRTKKREWFLSIGKSYQTECWISYVVTSKWTAVCCEKESGDYSKV